MQGLVPERIIVDMMYRMEDRRKERIGSLGVDRPGDHTVLVPTIDLQCKLEISVPITGILCKYNDQPVIDMGREVCGPPVPGAITSTGDGILFAP